MEALNFVECPSGYVVYTRDGVYLGNIMLRRAGRQGMEAYPSPLVALSPGLDRFGLLTQFRSTVEDGALYLVAQWRERVHGVG